MFLCTLSVLVCFVIANSGAQLRQIGTIEAEESRARYAVSQDIKDLVPVDFAASNLRKHRLKSTNDGNVPFDNQDINEVQKYSNSRGPKRFKSRKRPTDRSNQADQKFGKTSRKRPNKSKFNAPQKPSRPRTDSLRDMYASTKSLRKPTIATPRETIVNNFNRKKPLFRLHPTMNSNNAKLKSSNSFDNIKKAINALPQQLVTVVRDDIDCNDNPKTNSTDIRGPPCALAIRSSGSSGDPWFSFGKVVTRNWGHL